MDYLYDIIENIYKAADGAGVKELCRDTQCVSTHCAMTQIKTLVRQRSQREKD